MYNAEKDVLYTGFTGEGMRTQRSELICLLIEMMDARIVSKVPTIYDVEIKKLRRRIDKMYGIGIKLRKSHPFRGYYKKSVPFTFDEKKYLMGV